jgi:hypothetical protein
MASARQLSKVLRTKCGLKRRFVAALKPPRSGRLPAGRSQNHQRWMASSLMSAAHSGKFTRTDFTKTGFAVRQKLISSYKV